MWVVVVICTKYQNLLGIKALPIPEGEINATLIMRTRGFNYLIILFGLVLDSPQ